MKSTMAAVTIINFHHKNLIQRKIEDIKLKFCKPINPAIPSAPVC